MLGVPPLGLFSHRIGAVLAYFRVAPVCPRQLGFLGELTDTSGLRTDAPNLFFFCLNSAQVLPLKYFQKETRYLDGHIWALKADSLTSPLIVTVLRSHKKTK